MYERFFCILKFGLFSLEKPVWIREEYNMNHIVIQWNYREFQCMKICWRVKKKIFSLLQKRTLQFWAIIIIIGSMYVTINWFIWFEVPKLGLYCITQLILCYRHLTSGDWHPKSESDRYGMFLLPSCEAEPISNKLNLATLSESFFQQ